MPRKGDICQQVQVLFEEGLVDLDSYPDGRWEQFLCRSSGDKGHVRCLSKSTGRTRVNPEQASKVQLRRPTRLNFGEGPWTTGKQPMQAPVVLRRGKGTGMWRRYIVQRGRSRGMPVEATNCGRPAVGFPGESERSIVVGKRSNSCGAKGPRRTYVSQGTEERGD